MLSKRLLLILSLGAPLAWADPLPDMTMYVPSVCLACIDYAEHLRAAGFTVRSEPRNDLPALKRKLKVPPGYTSEPTTVVAGYVIEGHVPAEDIRLLLSERPKAIGLAVPGLPLGAPGREVSNPSCETGCTVLDRESGEKPQRRELFETYLLKHNGQTSIYARH